MLYTPVSSWGREGGREERGEEKGGWRNRRERKVSRGKEEDEGKEYCSNITQAAHNLVAWFATVHKVSQEDGVLGPRQTACSHLPRALLDGDPLVVLVEGLKQEVG